MKKLVIFFLIISLVSIITVPSNAHYMSDHSKTVHAKGFGISYVFLMTNLIAYLANSANRYGWNIDDIDVDLCNYDNIVMYISNCRSAESPGVPSFDPTVYYNTGSKDKINVGRESGVSVFDGSLFYKYDLVPSNTFNSQIGMSLYYESTSAFPSSIISLEPTPHTSLCGSLTDCVLLTTDGNMIVLTQSENDNGTEMMVYDKRSHGSLGAYLDYGGINVEGNLTGSILSSVSFYTPHPISNKKRSYFGAGWWLSGLSYLHENYEYTDYEHATVCPSDCGDGSETTCNQSSYCLNCSDEIINGAKNCTYYTHSDYRTSIEGESVVIENATQEPDLCQQFTCIRVDYYGTCTSLGDYGVDKQECNSCYQGLGLNSGEYPDKDVHVYNHCFQKYKSYYTENCYGECNTIVPTNTYIGKTVFLDTGNGAILTFITEDQTGVLSYKTPKGSGGMKLYKTSGQLSQPGAFRLEMEDGSKKYYNTDGNIYLSEDISGKNKVLYCYTTDSNPKVNKIKIYTSAGAYSDSLPCQVSGNLLEEFTFVYDDSSGFITGISSKNGKTTSLGVDSNGNLTSIMSPGGFNNRYFSYGGRLGHLLQGTTKTLNPTTLSPEMVEFYSYYNNGRISNYINVYGKNVWFIPSLLKNLHDFTGGALSSLNNIEDYSKIDTNVGCFHLDYSCVIYRNLVSDAYNDSYWMYYKTNDKGQLVEIVDEESRITSIARDQNGYEEEITLPTSIIIKRKYDEKGHLLNSNDRNPAINVSDQYTYNIYGKIITHTDANNNVTNYYYYPSGEKEGKLHTIKEPAETGLTTLDYYSDTLLLKSSTDENGVTTSYDYDSQNKNLFTVSRTYGGQARNTQYIRDGNGNISYIKDESGEFLTPENSYNEDNMLDYSIYYGEFSPSTQFDIDYAYKSNIGALESKTTTSYGQQGQIVNVENFWTDKIGRVTRYYNSMGKVVTYSYDIRHLLVNSNITGNGYSKAMNYTYNNDSQIEQVESIVDGNTEHIDYVYKDNGQLDYVQNKSAKVSYQYDEAGRPKIVQTSSVPGAQASYPSTSITYQYYNDSSVRQFSESPHTNLKEDFVYQSNGDLDYLNVDQQWEFDFSYDETGKISSILYPSGVSASFVYHDSSNSYQGMLQQIDYSNVNSGLSILSHKYWTYAPSIFNNITTLVNGRGGSDVDLHMYSYDNVGPHTRNYLLKWEYLNSINSSSYTQEYVYDNTGNRVELIESASNGGSTTNSSTIYDIDDSGSILSNKLLDDETYTYVYDTIGNVKMKSEKGTDKTISYSYNNQNQLEKIDWKDGSNTYKETTYFYDPLGRRVVKEVDPDGQGGVSKTTTKYIYSGENVIGELDNNDNLKAKYIHGLGIDDLLMIGIDGNNDGNINWNGNEKYLVLKDQLGNTTGLTDLSGNLLKSYTYKPYGEIQEEWINSNYALSGLKNNFLFTGREYDDESGLYYLRARYYDPEIGRFLQEDPVWHNNLYIYARNNPLNLIDPFGLMECPSVGGNCAIPAQNELPNTEAWGPFTSMLMGKGSYAFGGEINAGLAILKGPSFGLASMYFGETGEIGPFSIVEADKGLNWSASIGYTVAYQMHDGMGGRANYSGPFHTLNLFGSFTLFEGGGWYGITRGGSIGKGITYGTAIYDEIPEASIFFDSVQNGL